MAGIHPVECQGASDNSFGPVIADCHRLFDFTLLFEDSIFSVLPSAVLLLLAPLRLVSLNQRRRIVGGNALRVAKLCAIAAFGVVQVAIISLWALQSSQVSSLSIAAASLYLLNSAAFMVLSNAEHAKSSKPSVLLNFYLLISILLDAVRTRTLWLISTHPSVAIPFSVSLGLKILILSLEEISKSNYIDPEHGDYAPEETAGIFNRSLFLWLNSLIFKGFSQVLAVESLPTIDRRLGSEVLWTSFSTRWERSPKQGNFVLLWTLLGALKWAVLAPVIPNGCLIALTIAQPLLINAFLAFLSTPSDGSQEQKNVGYGLVGAYGLVYLGIAFSTAWAQQSTFLFVSMVRGCLVTVIYRKTTGVSIVGLDDATAVTLMSTDVERVVHGFSTIHEIWSTILQIGVSLFLLYRMVSAAFVVPLLMFVACGLAVGSISSLAGQKQVGWMAAIEKRIGVTSSMVGAMKGVKLTGLSRAMASTITNLRLAELSSARLFRNMLVYIVMLSFTPNSISPIITFGVYTVIAAKDKGVLSSNRIFTSLSLLTLITQPLSSLFQALPELSAAVACVGRIQSFLLAEPRHDSRESYQPEPLDCDAAYSPMMKEKDLDAISIKDGVFGWKEDEPPILKEINLRVVASKLTILIGQVGCGKSTLLKAVLGETAVARGQVIVASRDISFCDQTPWLTNGTIQENIIGFANYDPNWYSSVLRACALEEDLARFPRGDKSVVGSNGISLSGGQKQRVAIARAIYARRPIAIFDDVLSGLDFETQKQVFDNVFGADGILRSQGSTAILATHAVQILPYADNIIALSPDGKIAAHGSFDALNQDGGYLRHFGLQTHEHQSAVKADAGEEVKVTLQTRVAEALSKGMEDGARRLGDRTVYKYYFKSIGIWNAITLIVLLLAWVVMTTFPQIWLKWWGDSNERTHGKENGKYLGIYTVFQVSGLVFLVLAARHLLLSIAVSSGQTLHASLLKTTLIAPMSFFIATDVGAIVNRFSQDIQIIDAELPLAVLNLGANLVMCLAQAVMILPASFWLVFAYPFLIGVLYGVQKYYLRASRQLRFLDLEAKTPLYSQFLETLAGLATIRAFSWQEDLIKLSERQLDYSQKPFYLLFSVQRWLNLVLDLITAALAIILTAVAVALKDSVSAGFAGIALYNVTSLSGAMKSAVSTWTLLETSIGAVARVKSFEENTPSEHLPAETGTPPDNWPHKGAIKFDNVCASYKENSPRVLNKLSLSIKAGEKIGICGRSGSGKSSLVLALFRLIELQEGVITIDGLDISDIPRDTVRERLNAIPQEPVLISGTIREICDPRGVSSTDQILDALEKVQMAAAVDTKGGIDATVTQDSFSHGQRQLICLARAILHPGNVVVMDEATSNVDVETEKIMQEIIESEFKDATVITIAHRLDSILGFDNVVVVDSGVVLEYGTPQKLMAGPSAFRKLYETYSSKKDDEDTNEAEI